MRRVWGFVLVLGLGVSSIPAAPPASPAKPKGVPKASHPSDAYSPEEVGAALDAAAGGGNRENFNPTAVADREGVTIIQIPSGTNYDESLPGGAPNVQARADVAKAFYQNGMAPHGDAYDFMIVLTDFPFSFSLDGTQGINWGVRSFETGIGKAPYDAGSNFGSDERLSGYVDLGHLNPADLTPGAQAYTEAITVLMHELGHRWLAYANVNVPGADIVGFADAHWSYYLANGGSFLYGADWFESSPGTWVSHGERKRYSDLDLYLMGLIPESEVAPFKLLTVPGGNGNQISAPAGTVLTNVTPITITVGDVIAANGARIPNSQTSRKDFRAAVIYLTEQPPSSIPTATLQALRQFGVYGSQQYFFETGGRGTVETGLLESPPPTGQTIDVVAALAWLRSQQKPDGSWEDSPFTRIRDAAEATQTLRLDPAAAAAVAAGEGYLLSQTPESTDFLARTISALGSKALASQISELSSRQSSDGGFGAGSLYKPDPLDTALARLALAQLDGAEARKDLAVIIASQNADGGWPQVSGGPSRVIPSSTALRLLTLAPDGSADPTLLAQARANALAFLLGEQNEDGGFGDSPSSLYGTALAYETLKAIDGVAPAVMSAAEDYLAARQESDGSFGQSVYATAIVARALSATLLPDLIIDAVNPENTPFAGTTANVVTRVRNRLGAASPAFKVRLWDGDPGNGGIEIGTAQVGGLPPATSLNVNIPWPIPANGDGEHKLHAMADADAQVLEAAEDNNKLVATVVVLPKDSDLSIDSFVASPNPATTGQTVDLTAVIRSVGSRTVPQVRVTFRAGADLIAEKILDFQGPGTQTASVSYSAPATPGDVTLSATVDPADLVEEVDETNNVALVTLSVVTSSLPNAKVSASDISFNPPTGVNGQPVVATVIVHNTGGADIASMRVDLYKGDPDLGGVLVDTEPAVAVAAGATTPVDLQFTAPGGASQIMTVLLDGPNAIAESNETDNKASKLLPLSTESDLSIAAADIGVTPAFPRTGDPVTIAAVVRNFGASASAPSTVKAFLGDPATGTQIGSDFAIPAINPGASATATFPWSTTGLEGLQTITIQVIPGGADADPMNNQASRSVGIQNADFFAFTPYFSPNGDGVLDVAAFGYRIDPSRQARITVYDRFDREIATLVDQRNGADGTASWDGRNTGGRIQPDGTYDVVFEAVQGGQATPLATLSCEIDTNRRNLPDLADRREFLESAIVPCGLGTLGYPAYGPDEVLYVPVAFSPNSGLYAVKTAGVVPVLVPAPGGANPSGVDISPDGRFATLRMYGGALYLLALDQQPVTATLITSSGNIGTRAAFSHDSRKVAFMSDNLTLAVVDVSSPTMPQVVADLAHATGTPAWSPDDRFLYFGNGGLLRAEVATGDVMQVLNPPNVSRPSWTWPQELPGGALLISEASCIDSCAETGSNFTFTPGSPDASPIVGPTSPLIAPGLYAHESQQASNISLGTLGSTSSNVIYVLKPFVSTSRVGTAWSPNASRVAIADNVCQSQSVVASYVDNRSLLNGTARLSYRVVSDGFAVEIRGTAADLNVKGVRLEYASFQNPGVAIPLVPAIERSFVDEVVVTWVPPADGLYEVRLSVEDLAGNVTQETVNIDWVSAFPLRGITVEPKYVSPAVVDGRNDALNIHFDVAVTASYQFELVNEQGATVRTYTGTSNPATGLLVTWDGRTQGGSVASDGLYQVRITADTGGNPKTMTVPEAIEDGHVLDNTLPAAGLTLDPTRCVVDTDFGLASGCTVPPYLHFLGLRGTGTATDANFKEYLLGGRRSDVSFSGPIDELPLVSQGHDLRGQPIVLEVEDLAGNRSTVSRGPASLTLAVTTYGADDCNHETHDGLLLGRAYREFGDPLTLFNGSVFIVGHSWPGDAVDFTVEIRPMSGGGDYQTINVPVTAAFNLNTVSLDKASIPEGEYFVRFRAKDGNGTTYVTEDERIGNDLGGGTGCGGPISVTDHPATDCPADPPDFDLDLLSGICGTDPVTYEARSRATGVETTIGVAPAGQVFAWHTAGFAEGIYDLRATNAAGDVSDGTARVDRTPPAIQLLTPTQGQSICGPVPVNVVATDASPMYSFHIAVGQGQNPVSWTELCPVDCAPFDGTHPTTFDPSGLGLPSGFYTIRARVGERPNENPGPPAPYFCREARVTVYVDAGVDIGAPLVNGSPFSPNGDSVKDTVELRYSFAEPITVDTVVLDPTGQSIVRTLEAGVFHDPAVSTTAVLTWDGHDDFGAVVPDGDYTFRVTAHDGCAVPNVKIQTASVTVDHTAPAAAIDAPTGSIQPIYFVRGTASDLHFEKYELLLGQGTAPTTFTKVGEGTSPKTSQLLSEVDTANLSGDYVLRLHVTDRAGNESVFDQPLFFGGNGMITQLRGDPSTFSPNGDGLKDDTTVRYSVSRDVRATLTVVAPGQSTALATLVNDQARAAGSYTTVWNGGSLADGDYELLLHVVEDPQNPPVDDADARAPITIDTASPAAAITNPPANGVTGGTLDVIGTASDPHLVVYTVELKSPGQNVFTLVASGSQNRTAEKLATLTGLSDGAYQVRLRVSDAGDNVSTVTNAFVVDTLAPVVTLGSPRDGLQVSQVLVPALDLTGTVADANPDTWQVKVVKPDTSEVLVASGTDTTVSGAWTITVLPDGIYRVRLIATDKAGNSATTENTVTLDATPPAADITIPVSGGYVSGPTDIVGTASDANIQDYTVGYTKAPQTPSSLYIPIGGGDSSVTNAALVSWTAIPPDGLYVLRLTVRDLASNTAAFDRPVVVDTVAPGAPVLTGMAANTSYQLSWTGPADTDLQGFEVWREGVKITTSLIPGHSYVDTVNPPVTMRYQVRAVDLGDKLGAFSNEITLDGRAPETRIDSPQNGASVMGDVLVIGRAWAPAGFDRYEVLIGQGSSPTTFQLLKTSTLPVGDGLLATWPTFGLSEGPYVIRLVAYNTGGQLSSTQVAVTVDNTPGSKPTIQASVSTDDVTLTITTGDPSTVAYNVFRDGQLITPNGILRQDPATTHVDGDRPDGTWVYVAVALDAAGNQSPQSDPASAVVDIRRPPVDITQPLEGDRFLTSPTVVAVSPDKDVTQVVFAYAAQGGSFVDFATDAVAPYQAVWDITGLPLGAYQLRATACDATGCGVPDVINVSIEPAAIVLSGGSDGGTVHLSWTAFAHPDLDSYRVMRGTEEKKKVLANEPRVFDDVGLADGPYSYTVVAKNAAGATLDTSNALFVNVWTPTLSRGAQQLLVAQSDTASLGGSSNPKGTASLYKSSDNSLFFDTGLRYVQGNQQIRFPLAPLSAGPNFFRVRVDDGNGSRSRFSTSALVIQEAPPEPPTNLDAVLSGPDVSLSFVPSATPLERGTFLYRNSALLNTTVDASFTGATSNGGTGNPAQAFDGDTVPTAWTSSTSGDSISANLVSAAFGRTVQVFLNGSGEVRVETDGPGGLPVVIGQTTVFGSAMIDLPQRFPMQMIRLVAVSNTVEVTEIRLVTDGQATGTTFIDHNVPQGLQSYTAKALANFGTLSGPSDGASVQVGTAGAIAPPVLLFPASASHPQSVDDPSVSIAGLSEPGSIVALKQDGEASGSGTAREGSGASVLVIQGAGQAMGLSSDGGTLVAEKDGVVTVDLSTYETTNIFPAGSSQSPSTALRQPLVAFVASLGGQQDLHTYDLVSGVDRKLTNDATAELAPSLDAAGGRVAFVSGTGIRVVDVASGSVLRSDLSGNSVRISPDGARIAFRKDDNFHFPQLWVADAIGTAPAIMIASRLRGDDHYSFSGDSQLLVHASDLAGGVNYRINVTELSSNTTTQASTPSGMAVAYPRFAPGGRYLAYTASVSTETSIHVVDLAAPGTDMVALSESLPAGSNGIIALGFDKDARLSYVLDGNLFRVEPLGRFEIPTIVDAGPNAFTATAVRTAQGSQPSVPSQQAIVTLTDPDAPNLRIDSLVTQPPVPVAGEMARLTAVVRNDGSRPAPAFAVDFLIRLQGVGGAIPIGPRQNVPSLAAGATTVLTADLDTSGIPGLHEISVVADVTGQVPERDELDNSLVTHLRVVPMPGVNVATTVTPASARPGDSLSISTTIVNAGPDADLDLVISFQDAAGTTVATILTRSFPGFVYGQEEQVQTAFVVPQVAAGAYTVKTRVLAAGSDVATDSDAVTVLDAGTIGSTLVASELLYQRGEQVRLEGTVSNTTTGTTHVGLVAKMRVRDDATQALRFSEDRNLPPLLPGQTLPLTWLPDFFNASAGSYTATMTIVEAGQTVATSAAPFGIAVPIGIAGVLTVGVGSPDVTFHYDVESREPVDIPGTTIRVIVFDPRDGSILAVLSEVRTLTALGTIHGTLTLARSAMPDGEYAAALQAEGIFQGAPFLQELDRERFSTADDQAPVVIPVAPAPNAIRGASVVVQARATDDGVIQRIEALIDGHASPMTLSPQIGDIWGAIYSPTAGEEGPRSVTFTAFDAAGHASTPITVNFVVDLTPPKVTVGGVTDGGLYTTDLYITVDITDLHPGISTTTLNGIVETFPYLLQADGHYRLEVVAADLAQNTTIVVINFRKDNENPDADIASPADQATVVESQDVVGTADDENLQNWILSYYPAGNPGGAVTLATGTTPVRGGHLGTFDPTPLADGQYVLKLVVNDTTGRTSQDLVTVNVQHADLEITKTIPFDARVLIWAGCATGNYNCGPVVPSFVTSTLTAMGIPYETATSDAQILDKVRSGRFNVYILYKPPTPNLTVYTEIREAVARGEGLIVIKEHPDNMPNLVDAIGVKFKGNLNRSNVNLNMLQSPITTPGTVAAPGASIKVELQGASQAATFASGDPAITYFGFGLGRTVMFAFDLQTAQGPALQTVLQNTVNWVTPSAGSLLIPGGVVPVQIAVENRGTTAQTYQVIETVPPQLTVLAVYGNPTSTNPPTWEGTIAPGATVTYRYLVRLPQATGTYTTQSDLYLSTSGGFVLHKTKTLNLVVAKNGAALYADVLAELNALELAYPGQANKIQQARTYVTNARDRAGSADPDQEYKIDQLLSAADKIATVQAPIATARSLISTVMRYEEIRWATN